LLKQKFQQLICSEFNNSVGVLVACILKAVLKT